MVILLLPLLLLLPLFFFATSHATLKDVVQYATTLGVILLPVIRFFR